MLSFSSGEFKAEDGALSGTCHKQPNVERVDTATEAYTMTAFVNSLNPDAFPGIRKIEAEVVRMTLNLFNGNDKTCGTVSLVVQRTQEVKGSRSNSAMIWLKITTSLLS